MHRHSKLKCIEFNIACFFFVVKSNNCFTYNKTVIICPCGIKNELKSKTTCMMKQSMTVGKLFTIHHLTRLQLIITRMNCIPWQHLRDGASLPPHQYYHGDHEQHNQHTHNDERNHGSSCLSRLRGGGVLATVAVVTLVATAYWGVTWFGKIK